MQFLANEFEPEAARLTVASRPVLPLHDEVDALTFVTDDAVKSALLATLGMTSRDVAAHRDFVELRNRLSAGIIALKFNAEMYPGLLLDYVELYDLSQLLRDDSQPSNGNISGRALLRRPNRASAAAVSTSPQIGLGPAAVDPANDPDEEERSATGHPAGRLARIWTSTMLRPRPSSEHQHQTAEAHNAQPPTSSGRYRPALLQLYVIRQQIKRYEGGDISDVQNVLRSEHKTRELADCTGQRRLSKAKRRPAPRGTPQSKH